MLSSKHSVFKLAAAAWLLIPASGSVQAQGAPALPPTLGASPTQGVVAATAPPQSRVDKGKAPQAPGASRRVDEADSVTDISLKEFATLERKRALAVLRKEIKEGQDADKKNAAPVAPKTLPAVTQFSPAYGFQPGMPVPPGMTPAMLGRMSPSGINSFASSAPRHKVVSIVSFQGDVRADVMDGELITTVKVGDKLGAGKVVSIDVDQGVRVESIGPKGVLTVTQLPPATDMESRGSPAPQMGSFNPIPPLPAPGIAAFPPPDASSVPMAAIPPQLPARR